MPFISKHTLAVDFQGSQLTSDAGLLLLCRAEAKVGLLKAMAQAIQEIPRDVVQLLTNSGRRSCTDPIPRFARLDLPGLLRHGMERGIEKRDIFLYNADREYFMQESSRSILDKGREREAGLGGAGAIRNAAGLSLSAHPPA